MINEHDMKDMLEISAIKPGSTVEYKRADGITVSYFFEKIEGKYAHLYPIDHPLVGPVYCDLSATFYVR